MTPKNDALQRTPMRVLVTGANGFIGRHICHALADDGHEIVGLIRPSADRSEIEQYTLVEGDLTVPRSLIDAVGGVDAVVHTAGVREAVRESTYERVNTRGSAALAEVAAKAGIERVVFISSIAAQGPSRPGRPHVTGGSEAPLNAYGRSKLAAEQRMRERLGDALIVLRPGLVYGPDDDHLLGWARVVQRRIVPMVVGLELSMLHVADLAQAVGLALRSAPIAEPLFLSDDTPLTFEALIDRIERLVASGPVVRVPLPSGLLSRWVPLAETFGRMTGLGTLAGRRIGELTASGWTCSATLAREHLGFAPRYTQIDGVPAAIAAMQAAGSLAHRLETDSE